MLGRTSAIVIILPFVGDPYEGMHPVYTASPSFPPILLFPYLYLSLYEIFSVSVLVFLINIQSVNSCNFGVLNKGGEFRVFLLNHLGHPPKISFHLVL